MITMMWNEYKNLLFLKVLMKLLLCLKSMMMMFLTNLKFYPYLNIDMRIMIAMLILLNLLKE